MLADHIGIPQLREMAGRSEQVSGEVGLRDLSRLAALLYADADKQRIEVQLRFHRGAQGFPEISGKASGSIELRCQRCLGALAWPVDLEFQLAVVESDSDVEEVARPFDTLVAGEHGIELAKLVEDELLGSLPLAPMHEDFAVCAAPDFPGHSQDHEKVDDEKANAKAPGDSAAAIESAAENEETHRPFAGLATLLNSGAKGGNTD